MTQAAPLAVRVTYAVYTAPYGSPAPIMVVKWKAIPGMRAVCEAPIYAASPELAKGVVPNPDDFEWEPHKPTGKNDRLLGVWKEKRK